MFHLIQRAALAAGLILLAPMAAGAVPDAFHVRCEVYALRLAVNDFTERVVLHNRWLSRLAARALRVGGRRP